MTRNATTAAPRRASTTIVIDEPKMRLSERGLVRLRRDARVRQTRRPVAGSWRVPTPFTVTVDVDWLVRAG